MMLMKGKDLIKYLEDNDLLEENIVIKSPIKRVSEKRIYTRKDGADFGQMKLTTSEWNSLRRRFCTVQQIKDFIDNELKSDNQYSRKHPLAYNILGIGELAEMDILEELDKELKRRSK